MSKEPVDGFILSLEDFTGDMEILVKKLEDTLNRLKKNYKFLTLVRCGDAIQLYAEKINN